MADPFSIIGLVITTLETINITKNYVDSVRRAPHSITNLRDELASIESLLKQLQQIISCEREHTEQHEMYELLSPSMEQCEKVSKEVEKLIQPYVSESGASKVWERFSFGFKESEVQGLKNQMGECKMNLSLVIMSTILMTNQKTGRGIQRIQQRLGIATSSVAAANITYRNLEVIGRWRPARTRVEEMPDRKLETSFSSPQLQSGGGRLPRLPSLNPPETRSSITSLTRQHAAAVLEAHDASSNAGDSTGNRLKANM